MGRKNLPKRHRSVRYPRYEHVIARPPCPLCYRCGKQSHPNRHEAFTHAKMQGKTYFEVYPCGSGGFHITSGGDKFRL